MKLVVGLGNPGKEYENTRHNIGFELVDMFAKKYGCTLKKVDKFNAEIFDININGEKVIIVKPFSYMNLSGTVVKKIVDFYDIDIRDILVLHDDLDMVLGKIKIVNNSSSGGHNGIKNITKCLESKEYVRFKIGICGKDREVDAIDCVLGKSNKEQRKVLDNVYSKLNNLIEDFVNCDIYKLKQIYNSMNNKE